MHAVAYAVGRAAFTKFTLSDAWAPGHSHWRLLEQRSKVVRNMVGSLERKRKQASLQAAAPRGADIGTYGAHKMRKLLKDMGARC